MKPVSILNHLCIVSLFVFLTSSAFAQKRFTGSPASSQVELRSHFSDWSLYSINTNDIAAYTRAQKGDARTEFELELPGLATWKLSIAEHDILSKDYTLVINSPEGKTILPRPACITYAGHLTDNEKSRVRLTIDNDIIYGIIKSGDKEYFIEPLRYFDKQASPDLFVVYDTKNVNPAPGITCGIKETIQRETSTQKVNAGLNCVQTQLAIASDASMFTRYGSAAAVQTHNIGVMNNVIWDYVNNQFNDNVEFVIVTQNVSTSGATDQLLPAEPGTNSNTILNNFTAWGQAGNFGVTYDLAQFWTTRNIDGDGLGGSAGIVGLAWVGAVCTNARYHILEDFTGNNPAGSGYQLRVLTSHEIGHNFNLSHDAAGSGFIMAPSVGNTSTWSPASVAGVDAYVPTRGCLSTCNLAGIPLADFILTPAAACPGTSLQLIDHSLRGPTSWNWTLTGGTPASSTVRNPTVSYATPGVKTISLISTNSAGASTQYSRNILISNAPTAACTNTGASSDAGVKLFSLNGISKITGGSSVDGNKYMDFSCTDGTGLVANTNYTVDVVVGTTTPANQFNLVQFFIDYNNDGDFVDAGEAVYSSPACYIGGHSFSFTTPASPAITNQFLRARVIAKDCVGGVNSCINVTNGQVEDYSVYFASGLSLPVTLLDFNGYHYNGVNILNWETASEKDNSRFDIERSIDGISFEAIGSKDGAGNSTTTNRYSFTDPLANGFANYNRLYYRLKTIDFSGKAEYSKIISITNKGGKNLLLTLQPNPFNNNIGITIQLQKAGSVNMQLMDITGRIVYQNEKKLAEGLHQISYTDFQRLPAGTYVLKLTNENEVVSRLVEKR